MPNEESARRFIFKLIWPSRLAGEHRHTLVERLTELRDTKADFLTDDEYAEIRSSFLGELAARPRMPFIQVFIFLAFGAAGVAGIIYCFLHRMSESAWVPAVPLVASGLIWWRMEQAYAAKRNLSRTDRFAAVDELAASRLISADEAGALKARIKRLCESEQVV
jgi:hypothetical protein